MKPERRGKEDFVVESQPGDEEMASMIERLVNLSAKMPLAIPEQARLEHTAMQ